MVVVAVRVVVAAGTEAASLPLSIPEQAMSGPGTSVPGPSAVVVPEVGPGARTTTLDNGLRIITEVLPGTRSVSLGYWVGVGARDETPSLAGASHFLEHLMFKGTLDRSAHDIAEAIDAVGGEMNAFTAKEHTAFYARLPATALQLGLDVLGEVLSTPALRAADVDAERQVILEEIALDDDDPDERAQTLSHELLFPGHALGREVAGTTETVENLSADDIATFFGQWYRPANLVVAAAGAVDHDQVVASVEAHFGTIETGAVPARRAPGPIAAAEAALERPVEQVHLAMGWRAPDAHSPDRFALSILNQVLGGGMSARLFQHIREERGLVYSVYSYPALYQDAGCLVAYAGTSPGNLAEVRGLMEAETDRLAAEGISARELEVAKGYLQGSLVLGLEDSASRMVRLGAGLLVHGEVVPIDVQLAHLAAVTLDDVARVAHALFTGSTTVALVGHPAG